MLLTGHQSHLWARDPSVMPGPRSGRGPGEGQHPSSGTGLWDPSVDKSGFRSEDSISITKHRLLSVCSDGTSQRLSSVVPPTRQHLPWEGLLVSVLQCPSGRTWGHLRSLTRKPTSPPGGRPWDCAGPSGYRHSSFAGEGSPGPGTDSQPSGVWDPDFLCFLYRQHCLQSSVWDN